MKINPKPFEELEEQYNAQNRTLFSATPITLNPNALLGLENDVVNGVIRPVGGFQTRTDVPPSRYSGQEINQIIDHIQDLSTGPKTVTDAEGNQVEIVKAVPPSILASPQNIGMVVAGGFLILALLKKKKKKGAIKAKL